MSDKKISQLAAITNVEITGAENVPLVQGGATKQTTINYIRDYVQSNINLGNPVNSFAVNGNNLTATLKDGTTFDVDITALTTDTNTQLSDADITALGYLKTDTNTQLTDADITSLGYIKSEHNTQLSDADIATLGYIKTDTNTQLTDAEITALGYIKTAGGVTLTDSDIAAFGYIKTDNDTQLSDSDIAALGYAKTSDLRTITAAEIATLSHFEYNASDDQLVADRAIETTLNSLFLGEQHKMSSGSENIFFTNLTSNINFFPMWGGLKDQSIAANQGASGYIAPSGRVYSNMFSLPLGGSPDASTAVGYSGNNFFAINISGLGITTTAAESVDQSLIRLEYKISIGGRQVYKQTLPDNSLRSANTIVAGDIINWFFDHPVDVVANTTLFAEIVKVRKSDDVNLGVFQVRQGDTVDPNTGLYRYQATVRNRLFEDKDLEFSTPYLKRQAMDFGLDSTGSTILLRDLSLSTDTLLEPHAVNTLEAVANGATIKIKHKDGQKVIIESLPVAAASINGSFVNAILNQAIIQLNAVFTNVSGFASADTFVNSFTLSGNNLTLGLNDGTSYTVDVTSLGVDENKFVTNATLSGNIVTFTMNDSTSVLLDAAAFAIDTNTTITSGSVSGTTLNLTSSDGSIIAIDASALGGSASSVASGSVVGTDLVLVLDDASTVSIDASNMINGSSLTATNDDWHYSYGSLANQAVGTTTLTGGTVANNGPYYFGAQLTKGSEFSFIFQNTANSKWGIWDGVEAATAYNLGQITDSNWSTCFNFNNGFQSGSNTTLRATPNNGAKYNTNNLSPVTIRFGSDGHLSLIDLATTPETLISKTVLPLSDTAINLQVGSWLNSPFPDGIITDTNNIWSVAHDFNNTEAGVIDGIKDHTVIKSAISIVPGEKIMFMLDKIGQGDFFGTGYTNASTGVATAEEQLENTFVYQTNEALVFTFGGTSDWVNNTSANGYFFAANLHQYRNGGGTGTIQGMHSLRYYSDNSLQIWDEDTGERVATATAAADGNAIHLYHGVKGARTYSFIPVISKQTIGQGTQPNVNFVPTVANQTATLQGGTFLNFQILTSDNIVNQFAELDAPSWMTLDQNSGILSGTAAAFLNTAADTVVVNCKAGNAIGGTVNFTVTITITATLAANTTSIQYPSNNTSSVLTGNAANVTALQRAANGTGSADAWSMSMWVKPVADTVEQTLFYYGGDDLTNEGRIEITQFSGPNIKMKFGKGNEYLFWFGVGKFIMSQWSHILVTYDGRVTGNVAGDVGTYFGGFTFSINGLNAVTGIAHQGNGWGGSIVADKFKIGNLGTGNYFKGMMHQVAIWDTDESSNLAAIYNSGATQDLSALSSSPAHIYEMGSSITTVTDLVGSANLTPFGFTIASVVTDAP